MFSRFICINYMKTGKCTDKSCTLQHVSTIDGAIDDGSTGSKQPQGSLKTAVKKPPTAAVEDSKRKPAHSSFSSSTTLGSDQDSGFQPGTKVRQGTLLQ